MDTAEFVRRHPRLWHLAHGDAWRGIQDHGLLSAVALVRAWEVPADRAEALLSRRRLTSESLEHPSFGTAVLRDQKPLHEGKLASVLADGLTVPEWLRLLNTFVFLFPDAAALQTLRTAYADEPAVALEIDTAKLIAEYGSLVRLSAINTGAVLYKPAPRGRGTFMGVAQFDRTKKVREVAIADGLPDVLRYLVSATRFQPDGSSSALWPC